MVSIKTLKGKIVTINVFLVLVIVMIGLLSSFNIYRVGGKIDGLITNNYKSIDASTKMTEVIENQDKTILRYIAFENKSTIDIIYNNNEEFYKWLNVAKTNITEIGEASNTNKISGDYLLFVKSFSRFHEYQSSHTSEQNIEFYNSQIYPNVVKVKVDLGILAKLNEKAMIKGRDNAKSNALSSMYFILLISSIAAILGLIVSLIYTNKSLKPIYLLTETIKSVKQGEINKQEIGRAHV